MEETPNGTPSNIHFRKNLGRNLSQLDRFTETPSPTRPMSSVSFTRYPPSVAPSYAPSISIYSASGVSDTEHRIPPATSQKDKSKMSR